MAPFRSEAREIFFLASYCMYLFSRCSVEQRDSNTECHRILSYLLWYSTMVSVGRGVRSYICTDLLSTREGSPSKGGCKCTPLTLPPPPDPPLVRTNKIKPLKIARSLIITQHFPYLFYLYPFLNRFGFFLNHHYPHTYAS